MSLHWDWASVLISLSLSFFIFHTWTMKPGSQGLHKEERDAKPETPVVVSVQKLKLLILPSCGFWLQPIGETPLFFWNWLLWTMPIGLSPRESGFLVSSSSAVGLPMLALSVTSQTPPPPLLDTTHSPSCLPSSSWA